MTPPTISRVWTFGILSSSSTATSALAIEVMNALAPQSLTMYSSSSCVSRLDAAV